MKLAVLILALATLPSWAVAAQAEADRGRAIFKAVGCYACHGLEGQGGAGPRLAPSRGSDEASAQFVRNTTGAMPPYGDTVLSDADLKAVFVFLHSIPKEKSPSEIPILNDFAIKSGGETPNTAPGAR